jgi:hypothetical protein
MEKQEFIKQATMGGPGLCAYAYHTAYLCIECGQKITKIVAKAISDSEFPIEETDLRFSDSDHLPQPVFFGESYQQEYCDICRCELPISVI